MDQDLVNRINTHYNEMSSGQRQIAEFILNEYDKAAFMTAARLGDKVGVSESTVVRFAESLGYDGYPKLKKALQELIRNKLTTLQRIELAGEMSQAQVLPTVLKADMNNIRVTLNEIDNAAFEKVVELVLTAKNTYILGLRSAAPLAQFLGYYLDFVLQNVKVISSGAGDIFEQMIHIEEGDVLIAISFPRYSTRTVDGMTIAKARGAKCVALTDSMISPLTSIAELTLTARSNMASFADSLVAPFSVANALLVAVSLRKRDEMEKSFGALEKIWEEHGVYVKKDKVWPVNG